MGVEIENREYGEDSSDEEREAIADRVSVYSDGLIAVRQMPVPTPFSLDLMWDRIREIVQDMPSYSMMIDLSETSKPSDEVRAHLKKLFGTISPDHVAAFTERNPILTKAASVIFGKLGLKSYSVHRTRADALAELRKH
jgi:hypothetical protein